MTYTLSSGTLKSSIPYPNVTLTLAQTLTVTLQLSLIRKLSSFWSAPLRISCCCCWIISQVHWQSICKCSNKYWHLQWDLQFCLIFVSVFVSTGWLKICVIKKLMPASVQYLSNLFLFLPCAFPRISDASSWRHVGSGVPRCDCYKQWNVQSLLWKSQKSSSKAPPSESD